MPSITRFSDGTFIASQHVGKSLRSADNFIEVLRSTDGGHSWINEGDLHGGQPDDGWDYRGLKITETTDGLLVMTCTRFAISGDAGLFDVVTKALHRPEFHLFWSEDQGKTWSESQVVPVDLPLEKYAWNGARNLFIRSPNRWMYPPRDTETSWLRRTFRLKIRRHFFFGSESFLGRPYRRR